MTRVRVRLTFPPERIQEPIIYHLVKDFDIVTNIRRADVRETSAWMLQELVGDESAIDKGIEWVRSIGIRVDMVTGDVLEG